MTTLSLRDPATVTSTPARPHRPRRIPVLVVAQDHRVRAALGAIIEASAHLELSGQVVTGLEARHLLTDDGARHTVIVDLDVPVPAGPLALVADLAPAHHVIALTARRPRALSAVSAGALAVASTVEEVEDAISSATERAAHTTGPSVQSSGRPSRRLSRRPSRQPTGRPSRRLSRQPAGQDDDSQSALAMSRVDLVVVLLAVFLPPWMFWFSAIAQDAGLLGWRLPQGAALWSMTLPLLGVVAWRSGLPGLRDLTARVTRWRVPVRSYAAALLSPLALGATAAGIAIALGAPNPTGQVLAAGPALGYLATGTGVFLLTEELAWRGVLLPRLLTGMAPWSASLVLGAIWAAWHLPLLHVNGEGDAGLPVTGFALLVVATSVLMTAVVGLGRGSVLVAALAHAALDASYSWFGVVGPDHRVFWSTVVVATLVAIVLVVVTKGRLFMPARRVAVSPRSSRLQARLNPVGPLVDTVRIRR